MDISAWTDIIEAFTKEEEANAYIQELRLRAKRCRCSFCGSELILRRIIYGNAEEGRIDIFCPQCQRIEYGVEPELFKIAQYYVDEIGFDYYHDLDESTRKERMNLAKVCEIMQWCCKNLGFLNKNGFVHTIQLDESLNSQDLLLREKFLLERLGDENIGAVISS